MIYFGASDGDGHSVSCRSRYRTVHGFFPKMRRTVVNDREQVFFKAALFRNRFSIFFREHRWSFVRRNSSLK